VLKAKDAREMPERLFTIFQGPDAGRTFALADRPVTLGREEGREVVLHDDRASRLHARLLPDGDGAVVVDAGSSNGTFVNGILARERRIVEGDVVTIGSNSFVFGRETPSARRRDQLSKLAAQRIPEATGETTQILPESFPALQLHPAPAHLAELVNAAAEAAQPSADARGIRLSVEIELEPDAAVVDREQWYRAFAGLLAHLLEMWPQQREPRTGPGQAGTLALRLGPDAPRGGFQVELICIGLAIPRERIIAGGQAEPAAFARQVAAAHGGALHLLPPDSPDTLVRLRMPFAPSAEQTTTIRGPS
jgi:pSer/pThr/pTyr-binding forkhead associated (FHA) protein